ncbi:fructokinase-2 [Amborella trichopoda]|uniref:Carbohydrate kinase PfkB domain-containing protein n=1 Tax=Amborella trichopoda TaxID=13333 RepID=U5CYD3_AMBTC|nr:fructokinase-2 [Amborella trichopoda]ERN10938.1 hypothetical protein AMTR_s04407p00001830 [Amborella trichopoda]|eukprot:XP_006849357.1 fructokinase-2 [Amborella trichopoda]
MYAYYDQAKAFHYGSISLIAEPCRSAHFRALDLAREAGAILSYDPNLRLALWPSAEAAKEGMLSVWDRADVIKISDDEVPFITGKDTLDDDVAMSMWHPGLKLLIITMAERGCKYYTKEFHGTVDGILVNTVDTTGAGDAFVGAMLSQMVDDMSILHDEKRLREALQFANACGAITTTKKGAIPALPTKSEALSLLQETDAANH